MRFEWDPEKEIINIKKHGIDFTMASRVSNDPNFALSEDRITRRLANIAGRRLVQPLATRKRRCW
jgi:uncharacterized DUF497 family protein